MLSWLLLRGRCRRCAGPISPRYPLVEAATGFLFALAALFESSTGAFDLFDRDPLLALGRILYHRALIALLVVTLGESTACSLDDPFGTGLNLALFAVFLCGAVAEA